MTLSGSPTNYGLYGLGRRSVIFQSSGQKATFTTPSDCTGFDIFWTRGSSFGVLYYKVDGGSAVTINTAGSAADGQITQVRGLSAASHTIEVGWSSGGQTFFSGCMLYNGDESTGIRSFDGAHSGAFSSLFTATEWQGCLATVAPSLVVLELGVNDPSAPLTATQFQTNLTTLIAAITAAVTPQPSYVLMLDWNRGDYSDATWTPFVTATKAVAAANSGVLVFDLYSRTYDTQTRATNNSLGILASDKIHPVNLGQQYIADTLYEFVKP
jgi:lysophospholipase L1-like esterase